MGGKIDMKKRIISAVSAVVLLFFCSGVLFMYFTFYDSTPTNPYIVNNTSAVVCLVDDDGSEKFHTELQPILEKFDKECTLAVITDVVSGGGQLDWCELELLNQDGYDIVSHSDDHDISNWMFYSKKIWKNIGLSRDAILSSANDSYKALEINSLKTNIIVYPYGTCAKLFREICDINYDYGITTEERVMYEGEIVDGLALPRVFINDSHSIEEYYELIDQVVEKNGLLILGIHSSIPDEWSAETVEKIFEYIEFKDVDYCTLTEAIDRKLNKLN